MHKLPIDFDPFHYLELNPDVKEAGIDPYEHYLKHGEIEGRHFRLGNPSAEELKARIMDAQTGALGTFTISTLAMFKELRAEIRQLRDALQNNNIPEPPPAHLQRRVVAGYVPHFLKSGERPISEFNNILKQVGASIEDRKHILDFGVGCGRVMRRMAELFPNIHITGADIDPEAIRWLSENYSQYGEFVTLPHMPPSTFKSATFDLIYGISVFTHLNEEMQFAWLDELRRISAPGGLLLLTVHGEEHHRRRPREEQEEIQKHGVYFATSVQPTSGLPDFYRATFHTREYIEREWSRFFDILAYAPAGNEGHQDLILLRRT